jgi:hypothetical protein
MNIDQQIQKALNDEAQHLDDILAHEPGLFSRLGKVYQGSMRIWLALASIFALIVTAAFIYFGYQFYMASTLDERLFWAVWFLVGVIVQVAIKMWIFMEMNRASTIREVKRVEIAIERLHKMVAKQSGG